MLWNCLKFSCLFSLTLRRHFYCSRNVAVPCFKWIRLRVCTASQGSLNLCEHTHTQRRHRTHSWQSGWPQCWHWHWITYHFQRQWQRPRDGDCFPSHWDAMTCRARSRPSASWSWGLSRSLANGVALWTCRGDHFTFLLTETTQTASHYLRFCGQHARQRRDRERWIVRWCGVELPTCQPDSSSSGIIGLPQCLDYDHYIIR